MKNTLSLIAISLSFALTGEICAQTTEHVEQLTINVETPGTLGDIVLSQTENFSDVTELTVSGTLNSADYGSIRSRMTSLNRLDMSGVQTKSLPSECFKNCDNLVEVVLPASLQSVSHGLFYDCNRLSSVVIPDAVSSIADYAFYYCNSLSSIRMPSQLESIGTASFQNCRRVEEVMLPDGVRTLADHAFSGCSSLTRLQLPDGITEIGKSAFEECGSLQSVVLPYGLTSIEESLFSKDFSLQSVVIPEGVKIIKTYAFNECTKLEDVSMPSTLTEIGATAFADCDSLRHITLPVSLSFIGYLAFYHDKKLESVTCLGANPPAIDIDGITEARYPFNEASVFVPAIGIVNYKQTSGWDNYSISPLEVLPSPLCFFSHFKLKLPDTLPADYHPAMHLQEGKYSRSYYQYPDVSVSGTPTLSLSDFTMAHAPHASYTDGYHLYSSLICDAPMRADNVQVSYRLDDMRRWLFFSLPFNARMSDIELAHGSDFVVCTYSGRERAQGVLGRTWQTIAEGSTLRAGQGYIIRCSKDGEIVTFHAVNDDKKNNIFGRDDAVVGLEEYPSDFAHNRSWNFIGNPFPSYYDSRELVFDAPFVVWDESKWTASGNPYVTYTPYDDNYVLSPCQAFFVQCPIDVSSITFPSSGRQESRQVRTVARASSARRRLQDAAQRKVFNLYLSRGEASERTRLVLNENLTTSFDYGRDATRFDGMEASGPVLGLWTTDRANLRYTINERPVADGVVPMCLELPADGEYTLSLQTAEAQTLTLLDRQSGQRIRLTDGDEYTFEGSAGPLENRFVLLVGDATGIMQSPSLSDQREPQVYDLQGRRIVKPRQKGLYIVGGRKEVLK